MKLSLPTKSEVKQLGRFTGFMLITAAAYVVGEVSAQLAALAAVKAVLAVTVKLAPLAVVPVPALQIVAIVTYLVAWCVYGGIMYKYVISPMVDWAIGVEQTEAESPILALAS